ncbi:MAG: DEAD/DEAH box helicase family protein [Bacteroidales bacterium]|nr:DEAD/DEAH box helicase family protein [Bacteroidales bacterium]
MIYKLIERKRNLWLESQDCTVKNLIDYMSMKGLLRDAQLESVKTFLYLKLACENKPLWELLYTGKFNSLNIGNCYLTDKARNYLLSHKEAAALYEYAIEKKEDGSENAPNLASLIETQPDKIEYERIIKELFYNTTYVDYLFSIPMGAGKTWLMAMFIYINLYFAINEPDNPLFAHNFIIVAPAGLKSSILPSVTKDLKDFDPTIIFPEPLASNLKSLVTLEILGESSSSKGSNIVKNPNAQKVQSHQPFDDLIGLVMVTNAEKLYDKIEKADEVPTLWESLPEDQRDSWLNVKLANELREIIARVPNLCVMVDEMHHASEEQNLRKVIEKWVSTASFNSLLGFSGTPYFSSNKTITVADTLRIKYNMLGNVVTYYPLARAVNNFLKFPIIKHSDVSNLDIVRNGVREFLTKYKDKNYPNVGCAKLAIYCGFIASLENEIYPEVCAICQEFGLPINDTILRYYGNDNKDGFRCATTAQADFLALDSPYSKYKIVLLAQIGKEGWNCKSLSGVILPNPNSSARNLVLQTSCRCLREVKNARNEQALIWLSKLNHDLLDNELRKNHHTSIAELSTKINKPKEVKRYSREKVVKLPPVNYIQLHIKYNTTSKGNNNIEERLNNITPVASIHRVITQSDLSGNHEIVGNIITNDVDIAMSYSQWINLISKESFGLISSSELGKYNNILRELYLTVSFDNNGDRYLSKDFQQLRLRSDIRKCFTPQTEIQCVEELVPRSASLLNIEAITKPYYPSENRIVFPDENTVNEIISSDTGGNIPPEIQTAINTLYSLGNNIAADALESQYKTSEDPINSRTYQYIPYSFDRGFEKKYYDNILRGLLGSFSDIEVYFNGDEALTNFYIECYDKSNGYWKRIGNYFPDFLILKRNQKNQICKVILAETKGTPFEASFLPKKVFMEKFLEINNASESTQFEFLYIPESFDDETQYNKTRQKIENFLNA